MIMRKKEWESTKRMRGEERKKIMERKKKKREKRNRNKKKEKRKRDRMEGWE